MKTFQLCRLCSSKILSKDSFVNIFSSNHTNFNIRSMLHRYCWFLILEPDQHSQVICKQCCEIILDFHQFTNRIKEVQQKLYFIPLNTSLTTRKIGNEIVTKDTITSVIRPFIINQSNVDQNLSNIGGNTQIVEEFKQEDDNEEYELNKIIKIEIESETNNKQFIEQDDEDEENDTISSADIDNDDDYNNIDDCNINVKLKCQPKIIEKTFRKRTQIVKTEEQAKLDTEDALINEFYKRECELCSENYPSMHTLLKHYRRVHQLRGYLRCCGKKLKQRWEAMDHIALHKNPNAFHCDICNKSYQCHQSLAIHMKQHDPKFERYQCEQCPRSFMKPNSLKWHRLMDHVKKEEAGTFPCDQCNKVFLTDLIRRRHTSKNHGGKSTEAVCAICAKVCQTPSVLKKHHLAAHSVVPKVQCKECDRWFKNTETLRGHQLRHKIDLHTCEICNRQFPNSILFYTHNRRNHTPAKHACVVCNKAFSFKYGLKRHMARHTVHRVRNST